MNETEALAALLSIPYLGPVKIRHLLEIFNTPQQALKAHPDELAGLPGFGAKIIKGWKKAIEDSKWERDLTLAKRLGVQLVAYNSSAYPQKLRDLPDSPLLLYVLGNLEVLNQANIAIIGTRFASIYGLEMADMLSQELALQGMSVVSGLARGIDTAAHKGALKTGNTVAVIGSGLADIYPRENHSLVQEIIKKGAVISEFPMATPPDRQNFPQRNRIVSGMTLGTLLIEAPLKSGAMLTMEKGLSQGRPLFTLPGRIDNKNFQGNHSLIQQGKAILISSAREILNFYQLKNTSSSNFPKSSHHADIHLDTEEAEVWNKFPNEEITLEALEQLTELPIRKLNVLLMSLILKRAVKEYPGKIFKKAGIKEKEWANH